MRYLLYVKRLIGALVILALIVIGINVLNYVTNNDSHIYARLMMHELYTQDNIDIVFDGSSHCYRGINPFEVDNKLGVQSVNVSSSSQTIDGSRAIIKEILNQYDVALIVLDTSYSSARQNITKQERSSSEYNITGITLIADYLDNPFNRFDFLFKSTFEDKYDRTFFPFRRGKYSKLLHAKEVIEKKNDVEYKNYYPIGHEDGERYVGKGYVANTNVADEESYLKPPEDSSVKPELIQQRWLECLYDIKNMCDKEGAILILVNIPEPMPLIASYGNYDDYINYMNNVSRDLGVEYYNYNLLHEDIMPDEREYFKDNNHLNDRGAKLFSNILADTIRDPNLFDSIRYGTINSKLNSLGYLQ